MIRTNLLLFLVVFCLSLNSFSQNSAMHKIDVNKDIDVVKVYKQVVKEGYGTTLIYKELANASYFKSDYVEAKIWYEKLFDEEKTTDKTLLFRYRQSLKALGLYRETNAYLSVNNSN